MSDGVDRTAHATDDASAETAANGERVPTSDAAVRGSAARADVLEKRLTSENREAAEPSGTTSTDPAR